MPTHGMIEIVMPACNMPQSVPPRLVSVRDDARINGSVNLESLFIITSAPRYSFQDVMKANRATVMIAGSTAGNRMRRRICTELAPSIIAASSNSRGTASKLLRMMYRLNGNWMAVWMMARPMSELVNPKSANVRKIGVSNAWYGMI